MRRARHGPGTHSTLAWQEVGLWLLFVPPRSRRCREVVVRTLSDDSWSDLETHLEEEAPKVRAVQGGLGRSPGQELCPDPLTLFPLTPPPCPAALGSLPGTPLLVVPCGFTPCVQRLPGATRGDIAVLLGASWGQGHISTWSHRGASSRPHASKGRAAAKGGEWFSGTKA